MSRAMLMVHDTDPAEAIRAAVAPFIADVAPMGAELLVGVYERPEKTAAGLFLPDKTRGEDKFQGKVGLVLACGPLAFAEDDHHHWGDRVPKVGDWIAFNVGDTFSFELGGHRCRVVEDVNVKLILQRPDIVW